MSAMVPHQLELADLKRDWIDKTAQEVIALGQAGVLPSEWSTDDLHKQLSCEPYEQNWWGCLAAKMRNTGKIIRTGSKPSTRPEANGRWIAKWKFSPSGQ